MEAQVERYPCGRRKNVRTTPQFVPGDYIEFWSGEHGGMWKPGVVADDQVLNPGAMHDENERLFGWSDNIRIYVGNGITIIRPKRKCRMAHDKLPIDLVPGSKPPRFTWRQTLSGLDGQRQVITHDGILPAAVEKPVAELIRLYKEVLGANVLLSAQVEELKKQVANLNNSVSEPTAKPINTSTGKRKG